MSKMFKICIASHNANSFFICLKEGVHIWHNECILFVDYNKCLEIRINPCGQSQIFLNLNLNSSFIFCWRVFIFGMVFANVRR